MKLQQLFSKADKFLAAVWENNPLWLLKIGIVGWILILGVANTRGCG